MASQPMMYLGMQPKPWMHDQFRSSQAETLSCKSRSSCLFPLQFRYSSCCTKSHRISFRYSPLQCRNSSTFVRCPQSPDYPLQKALVFASTIRGRFLSNNTFSSQRSISCAADDEAAADDEEEPYPEDKPYSIKGDLLVKYESNVVRREMAKVFKEWWARGWAPWEEILSPESEFAIDSLQNPFKPSSNWESFKKIHPPCRPEIIENRKRAAAKTIQDQVDEFVEMRKKAIEMKESLWDQPLVFTLLPPRDWPPPGWKVDAKELAYIREAHQLEAVRLSSKDIQNANADEDADVSLDRWHTFMRQYHEWVAANKETLDKQANQADPQYVPGRRRTGKNYEEGMYELPMIYPGQHYWGVVTCVHIYQGAFVYIGAVHDGLVQAQHNDWYYLQKYIKVGMHVHVEVIAKRDPYRYRFPLELRFVEPNVDKFIFHRFKYPPVIQRPGDQNLDEVARDIKRPYIPEMRPEPEPEVDLDTLIHPCIGKVWKVHEAEQMTLDAEENPEENYDLDDDIFKQGNEDEDDDEIERTDCVWTKETINGYDFPKLVLKVDEKDLDLETARAERQTIKKMWEEANARGEKFVVPRLRKEIWMDELNDMHRRRARAELAAHQHDIICRIEFGLPIEEPGKYVDNPYTRDVYDPRDIVWRKDYLGDLSKRKSRRDKQSRSSRFAKKVAQVEEVPKTDGVMTGSTYIIQDADSEETGHWYISEDSENETANNKSSSKNWIDAFDCLSPNGTAAVIDEIVEGQDEDDDDDDNDDDYDDDDDEEDDDEDEDEDNDVENA
ncbi:hypothetical protein O6H91_12G077800 [Diphasiastrum complanatum]|uniref:Uncharacterized protein n=1 Tax=Diphasiastrum complanatum TaxID=34168 RepID=A0ACC2C3T1_DIPCM|nr:hypothetical protein O6H91_12G077800 [Diphasiastrum complanatum]